MAWTKNGTVTAITLSLPGLTSQKFTHILNHIIDNGVIDVDLRIDNLSTTTYAYRESDDGSADVTATEQAEITLDDTAAATERFSVVDGINIAGEEKLFIGFTIDASTAGPGTAPSRVETVGKQSGTSTAYVRLDVLETQAGAIGSTSNLTALGTD